MHQVPNDILQSAEGLDLSNNSEQHQQYQHIPQTVLNHQQQQQQQQQPNVYISPQQQQPNTVIDQILM